MGIEVLALIEPLLLLDSLRCQMAPKQGAALDLSHILKPLERVRNALRDGKKGNAVHHVSDRAKLIGIGERISTAFGMERAHVR